MSGPEARPPCAATLGASSLPVPVSPGSEPPGCGRTWAASPRRPHPAARPADEASRSSRTFVAPRLPARRGSPPARGRGRNLRRRTSPCRRSPPLREVGFVHSDRAERGSEDDHGHVRCLRAICRSSPVPESPRLRPRVGTGCREGSRLRPAARAVRARSGSASTATSIPCRGRQRRKRPIQISGSSSMNKTRVSAALPPRPTRRRPYRDREAGKVHRPSRPRRAKLSQFHSTNNRAAHFRGAPPPPRCSRASSHPRP